MKFTAGFFYKVVMDVFKAIKGAKPEAEIIGEEKDETSAYVRIYNKGISKFQVESLNIVATKVKNINPFMWMERGNEYRRYGVNVGDLTKMIERNGGYSGIVKNIDFEYEYWYACYSLMSGERGWYRILRRPTFRSEEYPKKRPALIKKS